MHGGSASPRAHDPYVDPLRAGHLRLPDDYHLRAAAVTLLQAPGLRVRPGAAALLQRRTGCPAGTPLAIQNGGSSSRSAAVAGTACLAAFFVTDLVAFFAAAFLAVVFFTAFLAALVAVVLVAFLAAVLPAFSGRGSNSKPILPSFCATRKA